MPKPAAAPHSAVDTAPAERIATIPNILSGLRLLAVPVFLWAILSGHDVLALVLLMASGITDYLDGKIARTYGLESRLGALLDPIADRLYIVSTLLGLAVRDVIPWWVVWVLFAREAFMGVVTLLARRQGLTALPVHFIGKAATFNLLYAFPLMLLGDGQSALAKVALPIGWGFAWWGIVLYWVAGVIYAMQLRAYTTSRASA